jgi:hypothetical protein
MRLSLIFAAMALIVMPAAAEALAKIQAGR